MLSAQRYYDKVSCALNAQQEVNNQQGVTCLAMCRQVFPDTKLFNSPVYR